MIRRPGGLCVTNLTCLYLALNPGTHRASQWGVQRLSTMGTGSSIHHGGWAERGPVSSSRAQVRFQCCVCFTAMEIDGQVTV